MSIIDELDKFSASRIMMEVIKMLATAEVGRASDALELYKMIGEALDKSNTPLKSRKDKAHREAHRKTDSNPFTSKRKGIDISV